MKNLTIYQGKGRFESNNTIRVNDEHLQADYEYKINSLNIKSYNQMFLVNLTTNN